MSKANKVQQTTGNNIVYGDETNNETGLVTLHNPNLKLLDYDFLYHIELGTKDHDFVKMFGNVKYICMGGTATRMLNFIVFMKTELNKKLQSGTKLEIWQRHTSRYSMYKVGPILAVNHGIGIPSLQIILNELFKLMHYAKMKNPVLFRIGTSGGIGITPGSVVISKEGVDESINSYFEQVVLGKKIQLPSILDQELAQELLSLHNPDDRFELILGKTLCATDFYEGQGRLDGAFCNHTMADKMTYLQRLNDAGVCNIEMEATCFAALTHKAEIRAGICCVTMLDRLKGDQIHTPKEVLKQWEFRPQHIVARYIMRHL